MKDGLKEAKKDEVPTLLRNAELHCLNAVSWLKRKDVEAAKERLLLAIEAIEKIEASRR